jgi:HCOMODA/2-hydroxy-3-carboxy-muconic semialdehyde decarboxylase
MTLGTPRQSAAADRAGRSVNPSSAEAVLEGALICSKAGLVEAFGHVSARGSEGRFLLTPTLPLHALAPDLVLELDLQGGLRRGERDLCPLEAPMHAAIYAARADVGAICRTHSPYAALFGARGELPALVHGLGGLSGSLRLHPDPQLVSSAPAAAALAGDLGDGDCVLLRANGALCTGPDLAGACVRAWFLEERCWMAEHAGAGAALGEEQALARSRAYDAELDRAWRWLQARYGGHSDLWEKASDQM